MSVSTPLDVRFFRGGYCRQLHALVDRQTWRFDPFYAVFAAVAHPTRGWVLIDTGYSTHFQTATRGWPWWLYSLVTPVSSPITTAEMLRRAGIEPADIRDIVLTHFHADHIGGVRDFPNAHFHYCREALTPLLAQRPLAQVRHAFLPKLLPDDFAQRSTAIPLAHFHFDTALGFPCHDVFGDQLLRFVSLPGHAPGHVGIALQSQTHGALLYAADAFWHRRQIIDAISPMLPARIAIHDYAAYAKTITGLRALHTSGHVRLLACHCPHTF